MANSQNSNREPKGKKNKGVKQALTAPFTPVKQYEDGQTRPYVPQNPNRRA